MSFVEIWLMLFSLECGTIGFFAGVTPLLTPRFLLLISRMRLFFEFEGTRDTLSSFEAFYFLIPW